MTTIENKIISEIETTKNNAILMIDNKLKSGTGINESGQMVTMQKIEPMPNVVTNVILSGNDNSRLEAEVAGMSRQIKQLTKETVKAGASYTRNTAIKADFSNPKVSTRSIEWVVNKVSKNKLKGRIQPENRLKNGFTL